MGRGGLGDRHNRCQRCSGEVPPHRSRKGHGLSEAELAEKEARLNDLIGGEIAKGNAKAERRERLNRAAREVSDDLAEAAGRSLGKEVLGADGMRRTTGRLNKRKPGRKR